MYSPFFSIITPVYNSEKYIINYFDSLLKQSFVNFEIIIINDGSTDKSLEIINKYINLFRYITVINQNNCGQGIARNKALDLAKGEYILFIDSDDLLATNNSLKCLHNYIIKHPSDVVIYAYNKIYGKKSYKASKKHLKLLQGTHICSTQGKVNLLKYKRLGGPWNKAYSNKFLKTHLIKFAELLKFEDAYFFWQIIIYASKISFFNHVIYMYRKHNLATMRTNNKKNLDIIQIYSLILDILIKENLFKIYYKVYFYRFLNSFLSLFKKVPFAYKKDFFMCTRNFIVKYFINIYTVDHNMLDSKSKRILKSLTNDDFFRFYFKSFLL